METLEPRQLLATITTYPTTAGSGQAEVTVASGLIWFTELSANTIGSIDPAHPEAGVTSRTLGNAGPPVTITTGPDNAVWYTAFGKGTMSRLDPANPAAAIQSYALPGKNYTPANSAAAFPFSATPSDLTAGPGGLIWYTDPANNAIGNLDPAHPANTSALAVTRPAGMLGIKNLTSHIVSSAGKLWFTEASFANGAVASSGVGIYDPTANTWNEVVLPNSAGLQPFDITTVGQSIWVSLANITTNASGTVVNSAKVARIDPTNNNAVSVFTLPTPPAPANASLPYPYRIAAGPDGNLWFSDVQNGEIGTFNVTSHATTYLTLPAAGASPNGLVASAVDGAVWYADATGSVGRIIQGTQLTITPPNQPPATLNAGTPFGLTVYATNAAGTLDPSFNGNVTIALANNPGGSTLGGTKTVNAVNGVATFSGLTLDKASNGYTLTVSTSGLTSATTTGVNVSSAVQGATHLVVQSVSPTSMNPGTPFSVIVRAENASGAVDTTYTGSVTIALASNPGNSTLGGTLTVNAAGGVATFNGLTLNNAGNGYTLGVTASGLAGATTSGINVAPPAQHATHLVIAAQPPSSALTGSPFSVVVQALTDGGAIDPSFSGSVTISLANGASGLGGQTTIQAVNGVATFNNLTLANVGSGYALVVTSPGLAGTNSAAITVQAPTPPSPVIVAASIVMNPPKKKRGKATFGGFQIQFNSAMDGASFGNGNNYSLRAMVQVTQKVGKKRVKVLQPAKPVAFSIQVVDSTTVKLVTTNQKVFKLGGQLTLSGISAAGGIKSAAGGYLGGVTGSVLTFSISKNAKSITRIS
ncbi:virginiamycin B lyase family protein [Aquisphaera giovannonii]|nr:hypothetical protein [Aquisphaera giovannonii]